MPTASAGLADQSAPATVSHRLRDRCFIGQMEETVFDTVVTTHHGEIFRYLRRLAWRAAEADDLSQETFLRAYRAWPRLTPEANVRAWLFTIATNVYRNHVRSERRRQAAHATVQATRPGLDFDGPEEEAMADEMRTLTAGGDPPAAAQAAAGLHPAQAARARLRGDRAEPRVLAGERPRPRLPGAAQDPHDAQRPRPAPDGVHPMTSKPKSVCRDRARSHRRRDGRGHAAVGRARRHPRGRLPAVPRRLRALSGDRQPRSARYAPSRRRPATPRRPASA